MRIWNKKAVSGTIGALFVVILFLLVATSILSYRFAEDRYQNIINDRMQRDWERYNERLTISSAVRTSIGGTLNASIQNVGAVTAHLVTLFLSAYNMANVSQWQRQYAINIWIGPGTLTYNFGQPSFTYTLIKPGQVGETKSQIDLTIEYFIYVIKLVTERGNIVTYILTPPGLGPGPYPPTIVPIPGTMRINWGPLPINEANWIRPYVWYETLHTQASAGQFYFKAQFVNNWDQAMILPKGTILMQICSSPANKKVLGFGGHILSGPPGGIWNPGEPVTIVFKCDTVTWQNLQSLAEIFDLVAGVSEVPFTGSAAFTSNKPTSSEAFHSGAVLIDGLLVYYYPT